MSKSMKRINDQPIRCLQKCLSATLVLIWVFSYGCNSRDKEVVISELAAPQLSEIAQSCVIFQRQYGHWPGSGGTNISEDIRDILSDECLATIASGVFTDKFGMPISIYFSKTAVIVHSFGKNKQNDVQRALPLNGRPRSAGDDILVTDFLNVD